MWHTLSSLILISFISSGNLSTPLDSLKPDDVGATPTEAILHLPCYFNSLKPNHLPPGINNSTKSEEKKLLEYYGEIKLKLIEMEAKTGKLHLPHKEI